MIHRAVILFVVLALGCGASVPRKAPAIVRAKIHTGPRRGVLELVCNPDIEPSKDPAIRTSACEAGDLYACHRLLAEDHPTEALTATALKTLESGCKDVECACALYGSALTYDPRKRFDDRALAILDEACAEGALIACDEIVLIADLCSQRTQDRPMCEPLREAGIAHPPDPPPKPELVKAELPEYLLDCFVVMRDLGADKCEVPRLALDRGACPARELGAVYCFGPDRMLFRKPRSAEWRQVRTEWRGMSGDPRFVGLDLSVQLDGREALIDGRYRLLRADEKTRASATWFLAFALDVCVHAKRCVDAIDHAQAAEVVEEPELPSDAAGCKQAESNAKAGFRGELPAACK